MGLRGQRSEVFDIGLSSQSTTEDAKRTNTRASGEIRRLPRSKWRGTLAVMKIHLNGAAPKRGYTPAVLVAFATFLAVAARPALSAELAKPEGAAAEAPAPLSGKGHMQFAGARSSAYGIRPFPSPEGWGRALKTMADYFPGSTPVGIWIVGRLNGRTTGMQVEFPRPEDGVDYGPLFTFAQTNKHEPCLNYFDENGIRVFLQIEPGYADMTKSIDLILNQYQQHPSVIGFGVDIEWFQNAKTDAPNGLATDALVQAWEAKVKAHNPKYRLFVKHFREDNLPPTYRGDVVFVDDSQQFRNLDHFYAEFKQFADHFYPSTVMFQIGYRADKPLWSQVAVPIPRTVGEKLISQTRQECGLVWVDFTLRDVLPTQ